MKIEEKRIVVKHVEKRVIVDSKKQRCRWKCMAKI
jgi:hypothetical protein